METAAGKEQVNHNSSDETLLRRLVPDTCPLAYCWIGSTTSILGSCENSCFCAAMNTQRLEIIRKRREEDDEEFMFLLLPILHYHKRSRTGKVERTQRHSSVLYGMQRVQGILDGHVKNCRVAYRMEPHIFRSLASYLRREKLLKDKRIKVEEKLAIFLYMLSHNASFEDLQLNFVKSQLQDKEKELKREYKMLKEARMQSGAGWDEKNCMIVAEKALWDNLVFC